MEGNQAPTIPNMSKIMQGIRDIKNGVNPEDARLQAELDACELDPLAEVEKPPVCISIVQNGSSSIFGTLGNFSIIIGKAKATKSFLVSIITAAALRNGTVQGVVKCSFPESKKRVVYFDTEMSPYNVSESIRRAFKMAGGSPEELKQLIKIYLLVGKSPEEMIEKIDFFLNKNPDVGLVVIDGAKDLVNDILSTQESSRFATTLRRWTVEKNVHILTVLHQNKADSNSRGHTGAELENKSETVAEIVRSNSGVSTVSPFKCRNRPFDKFSFTIDEAGLPLLNESHSDVSEFKPPKGDRPEDHTKERHQSIIKTIFKNESRINATEFATAIQVAFGGIGYRIANTPCRAFVSYYRQNNMIAWKDRQEGNRTFYFLPGAANSQVDS